jgi:hypothetical protein
MVSQTKQILGYKKSKKAETYVFTWFLMNNSNINKETWDNLLNFLKQTTGKKPADLKSVLYLIGIQELGKGFLHFSKEEKQDLMHIATCKVLSYGDYYTLEGHDTEGWPHWVATKTLPALDLSEQENLLKTYVVHYFRNEIGLHF